MPRRAPLTLPPAAMAELLKPATREVYEALQVAGPSTISDLARSLGRPADGLYYHLRKLVRVGVIRRDDEPRTTSPTPATPGRTGATYRTSAPVVQLDLDPTSRKSRDAWSTSAGRVLRLAEREVHSAIESRDVRTSGPRRNLRVRRIKARLTDAELRRVNALQNELEQILSNRTDGARGQLFAATLVLTPVPESKR